MRHGDKINNLGRKSAHRKATLAAMAISLIEHKRIFTTVAKAKALRTYVEPIINKSKEDTTHSRRTVFASLRNKEVVAMLFKDVATKVAERNGGYTRIIKLGIRPGDNAEKAMIELVDFNEIYGNSVNAAAEPAKKTRRSKAAPKKVEAAAAETPATEAPATDASPETAAPNWSTTEIVAVFEELVFTYTPSSGSVTVNVVATGFAHVITIVFTELPKPAAFPTVRVRVAPATGAVFVNATEKLPAASVVYEVAVVLLAGVTEAVP